MSARRNQLGDAVRNAETVVQHRAFTQFFRRTPRNHLTHIERLRWRGWNRPLDLARHGRVVDDVVAHRLAGIDHHRIHDRARNTHGPRRQRADFHRRAHLHDDLTAGIVRGQRRRINIDVGWFLIEADVAVRVGERPADQRDIDRKWLVAQQFAAIDLGDFDEIRLGRVVHASTAVARIDERTETDMREQPRPPRADLAEQLHGDAAGEDVGLDLVVARHLLHARRPHPVTADDALDHALVRETVHAARLAIADAERVHGREIARMAGFQEALLDGGEQGRCLDEAAPTSDQRDRVAILDQLNSGSRAGELVDGHSVSSRFSLLF